MAGELIIVAQAENGMAAEEVVIAGEEEHAATETHEGTEAESHETIFPPFDPQHFASQILWLVLTFGFLYVVLSRTALPRIGSILDQRRIRIEGDLKEADRLRQETDRAIQAYEQALAEARQRAHAIAEETRASIRADIDGKRAAVETDLAKKVADAEASIQASKAEALTNVETIAADTAAELVRRITGEAPTGDVGAAVSQAAKG